MSQQSCAISARRVPHSKDLPTQRRREQEGASAERYPLPRRGKENGGRERTRTVEIGRVARERRGAHVTVKKKGYAVESRDENGRERSGKPFNHYRNHIFLSGMETGTGTPDGNTKPILRDIGNGIIRSGIS